MIIDWPNELIESIARRRSVIFLGSGISANSKNKDGLSPKTWKEFLEYVMDRNKLQERDKVTQLLNEKKYLLACEMIVDSIGDRLFHEAVQDEYRRPGYAPADIHKAIFRLDSRIVVTVNVDKIYDSCVENESHSTVVIKNYYDDDLAKYLRSNDFLLIKAHGSVDKTENMIFTHAQYSKARCNYASFYQIMDSLILTHTFIFLGCGIDDPDISLLLENANFNHKNCPPHYFVTEENSSADTIQKILFANRNLKVITYKNVSQKHIELLTAITELSGAVDNEREILSQRSSW